MRRLFWVSALALCWCALGAETSLADPIVYTFETPQFTNDQMTPLRNIAPNVGPSTFNTSFTDVTEPNGYQITDLARNSLMVGQSLFAPFVTSPLTLTFNVPVSQLSVDFAINDLNGSPANFLRLVTPSGTVNQISSNVGGPFQGGTLAFTTDTPFTTATLQGFFPDGTGNQIAIDNLSLVQVPEPPTFTLLGVGLAGTGTLAWLRRKLASVRPARGPDRLRLPGTGV